MSCVDDKVIDLVHHHEKTAVEFSLDQPHQGSPETRLRRTPDKTFLRKFFSDELRFPDGHEAEIWGFEDETSGRGLPSPAIRVEEGQIAHVVVEPSKSRHTIHHHGIEPVPRNDGVGHTSYEVTGSYTYQWCAGRGNAGTYFYHCHVNTVLHAQMGMFGALIVDPVGGTPNPSAGKPGKPFADSPHEYDVESLWVPFAIDPRWHEMNHAEGLSGEDAGLNRFDPRHFYILGGDPSGRTRSPVKANVDIQARAGQTILIRFVNAVYMPVEVDFGGLTAQVIASDGRACRDAYGNPVSFARTSLPVAAAERYDFILEAPTGLAAPTTYTASVKFFDWRGNRDENELLGTQTAKITVT